MSTWFALLSARRTRGTNDACNQNSSVPYRLYYVLSTIPGQPFDSGFKDDKKNAIIMSLNQKTIWLWFCACFRSNIKSMEKTNKNVPKQIFVQNEIHFCVFLFCAVHFYLCLYTIMRNKTKKQEKQWEKNKNTISTSYACQWMESK